MLHFYNDLWALTQRTHALMVHWSLLCEPGDDGEGRLSGASVQDFLDILRCERTQIVAHLDALEQLATRTVGMMSDSSPSYRHTYDQLDKLLDFMAPYFAAYPDLDLKAFWECFMNNTHDHYYPLPR